jgi:hypothetical protein
MYIASYILPAQTFYTYVGTNSVKLFCRYF